MTEYRPFVQLPTGGSLYGKPATREELEGLISELRAHPDGSRPTIEIRKIDD